MKNDGIEEESKRCNSQAFHALFCHAPSISITFKMQKEPLFAKEVNKNVKATA
ncbi:hypothetical protein [Photobacterium sanguinicancri]|uniref:hypothetical protein n=1 Tax=Photobacterium sanguinicancri TaxID=875932 RepID=UPI001960004B|nr:hypothetical protein [Photobacterium sanguinicancri]